MFFLSGRVLSDALNLGGGWQNGSCHSALMLIGSAQLHRVPGLILFLAVGLNQGRAHTRRTWLHEGFS